MELIHTLFEYIATFTSILFTRDWMIEKRPPFLFMVAGLFFIATERPFAGILKDTGLESLFPALKIFTLVMGVIGTTKTVVSSYNKWTPGLIAGVGYGILRGIASV